MSWMRQPGAARYMLSYGYLDPMMLVPIRIPLISDQRTAEKRWVSSYKFFFRRPGWAPGSLRTPLKRI